jgi:prepilin-type N-terminal cleavage/methylation domain-containing protein
MSSVSSRADSGFTLVELVVALLLAGVIATTTYRVLLVNQRVSEGQLRRAESEATLREAAVILRGELSGLTPADSSRTDILAMSPSSVVYAATRSLHFLCAPPDTLARVVTARREFFGLRDLDPAVDSILLLVLHHRGESWVGAGVSQVNAGSCPDGTPGLVVRVTGVSPDVLASVSPSSPMVGFEITEMRGYRDSRGEWWIGMRRYQRDRDAWPSIQPVVGPLAAGGFVLVYETASGAPAGIGSDVHFIRAEVAVDVAALGRPDLPVTRRASVIRVFPRGGSGEG